MFSSCFARVIENHSLKLGLKSKAKQHSDFDLGSAKVIQELRFVSAIKCATSLQLD